MTIENEGEFTPEELAMLEEPSEEGTEQPQDEEVGQESQSEQEEANPAEEGAEPQEEAEKEPDKQTMVPHAAMHEERERRKAVEVQLQAAQSQIENINAILAKMQPPEQEQQEEVLDPEYDPMGSMMNRLDQLEQGRQQQQEQQEREQERQQIQQFEKQYIDQLAERGNSDPEFQSAIDFLFDQSVENYKNEGANEQQARQLTMRDAYLIAANAHNNGLDIGQNFYGLAYANGFKPQPVPDDGPTPPLEEKLESIQKGQEGSKTLSGKGGGAPEPMTLAKLANMTDAELDKWTTANPGMWEKLMGAA
ncbi:MAG: hypothetical protein N4A65_00380 [Cohaesibacter sp.]|jgi:hypothetical protein|nr:hypothetical protein [Cohaesibacter sp.]